jgi:hypothetical protein
MHLASFKIDVMMHGGVVDRFFFFELIQNMGSCMKTRAIHAVTTMTCGHGSS